MAEESDTSEPHPLVTNLQLAPSLSTAAGDESGDPRALADVVAFAGYLGDGFERDGVGWRIMYTDADATKWILVPADAIAASERMNDPTAAFGKRDVIWVHAEAPVGRGVGCHSTYARFLTGQFTRACDFGPAPSGGTTGAATGVFCEARTPSCCGARSYR